jgi:hypothetical protein
MSPTRSKPIDTETEKSTTFGRPFFLDRGGGRVLSANPDGSDLKTIISEGRKLPDGLPTDHWDNHNRFQLQQGHRRSTL